MNIKAAFILIKHDYICFHSINNTVCIPLYNLNVVE